MFMGRIMKVKYNEKNDNWYKELDCLCLVQLFFSHFYADLGVEDFTTKGRSTNCCKVSRVDASFQRQISQKTGILINTKIDIHATYLEPNIQYGR